MVRIDSKALVAAPPDDGPHAAQSIFDKIWSTHQAAVLSGATELITIDRILLHERTGGIALQSLAAAGRAVKLPAQTFATMDHVVDTFAGRSDRTLVPNGGEFIRTTREAATRAGVTLFDLDNPRQGIVHVISPELGIVLPGVTLVCPDSHTCSLVGLGAISRGIVSKFA